LTHTLVCSLSACIQALPRKVAASVTRHLAKAKGGGDRSAVWRDPPSLNQARSPAELAAEEEGNVRRKMAGRARMTEDDSAPDRAIGLMCGLTGCSEVRVHKLKYCGGCRRVGYCCAEHQAADWPTHRLVCKPAAQAAAAAAADPAPPQPEAAAASDPAPPPAEDAETLGRLSVRELRQRIAARGLDATGCAEKVDLVRLLLGARR